MVGHRHRAPVRITRSRSLLAPIVPELPAPDLIIKQIRFGVLVTPGTVLSPAQPQCQPLSGPGGTGTGL
eukprot:729466-Hanusia_phi.AAC.1